MNSKRLKNTSKFISLILRHKPETIGITLDEHGWANVPELIDGINRSGGHYLTMDTLEEIVRTDEKQRYSFNEDHSLIRANQGHSIPVDVELEEKVPPDTLWHGTGDKYVPSIEAQGLIPKGRLYVHLSSDVETARKVGSRHGKPVIYSIDCRKMYQDGCRFFLSANHVWLTKKVPVDYLSPIGQAAEARDPLAWEEVRTEHIIRDQWIDFRKTAYRLPDGIIYEPFYTYSRRDYVVIVATDTEGNYLCVRQFRQGIREVTTEFPAGGIERKGESQYGPPGDNPEENALLAARRELRKETGYESDEWTHLLTIPSNATVSDNYAHLFAAKNCRQVTRQKLDETEFLNVEKYSAAQVQEMIDKGEFQQAMHITAWLLSSQEYVQKKKE